MHKKQHESIIRTREDILFWKESFIIKTIVTVKVRSSYQPERNADGNMENREGITKEGKSMLGRKMLAAALVTGLTGTLVLGGCQSGGDKGKTAGGKDSVRFMVGGSAAELEQYKKAVDAFNEQSENVEVTFVGVPGDNYNEKIMTQLKSKEAPDCFYSEEASYGELNRSDMLLDVAKYLDQSDSNLKRADVPENLLENYTFEDKVTGVPVDCNPMVIYYNADLFKGLNIRRPRNMWMRANGILRRCSRYQNSSGMRLRWDLSMRTGGGRFTPFFSRQRNRSIQMICQNRSLVLSGQRQD